MAAKEKWSTVVETHFVVVVVVAYFGRIPGSFRELRFAIRPARKLSEDSGVDFRRTAEVTSGGTAAKFAEKWP